MEKQEKIFVSGLFFKRPDENTKQKAPWIKGHVSIKPDELVKWIQEHKNGEWLNLDLKESKSTGKLYFELNQWKPLEKPEGLLTEEENAKIRALREAGQKAQETKGKVADAFDDWGK